MKQSHAVVMYLMLFFIAAANVPQAACGEYHSEYPSYESKEYEVHHDYHPPAKKANVDINIPFDFHTIAKLGLLGLTQLKLLLALGKVAGAGLGVATLGLGTLAKIGVSVKPAHHHHHSHHKDGIAIDLTPHYEAKAHARYGHSRNGPPEKHY